MCDTRCINGPVVGTHLHEPRRELVVHEEVVAQYFGEQQARVRGRVALALFVSEVRRRRRQCRRRRALDGGPQRGPVAACVA